MHTVYALSTKGREETRTSKPRLPAELGQLLRMIDGRRSTEDLLASMAKRSAVKAGGLRWLKASGYIVATETSGGPVSNLSINPGIDTGSGASEPSTLSRPSAMSAPLPIRDDAEVTRILSDFMVQAIRRWLGDGGYVYRRQIERAASVQDLLPHLHPLIDAIVTRAGADAGAEFADTAAFILSPRERDVTLT